MGTFYAWTSLSGQTMHNLQIPTVCDTGQWIHCFDRCQLTKITNVRCKAACLGHPISWSMAFMLCDIVVVRTHLWATPLAIMAIRKAVHGFPWVRCSAWRSRALLTVEMNFHIDQSRLSFWLGCSLHFAACLWHQIWTCSQSTYIPPVRISQLCTTTGSVSNCVIYFQSRRGGQITFKNCGTRLWRCWNRSHIWGRRYQSGK